MPRAIILVCDSFGIGGGDEGADTFGNIFEATAPNLPNFMRWGLAHAHLASTGRRLDGINYHQIPETSFGYAVETSFGKDTPSGHWEMAGLPVLYNWGRFQAEYPSFPASLVQEVISQGKIPGILGNKAASGTEIIDEFGPEHQKTGRPICYTSGDSVFQIAAHEETMPIEELYELCKITRKLVDPYDIGRVIARPFIGEPGNYKRTGNRRDYATPPHGPTLLDICREANRDVYAIGKITDIFAHRGMNHKIKATGNPALFDVTLDILDTATDGSLIFTNFVDFDSEYGHRRDTPGYAKALEHFDHCLPQLEAKLKPDDIVIITADHGCDPTMPGSDHTREHIPVLMHSQQYPSKPLGRRETFADIGQSIAKHLKLPALEFGVSFI